jgi:hypothetical protein
MHQNITNQNGFFSLTWIISSVVQKWIFEITISNQFGHSNMFWNCILVMLQSPFSCYSPYTSPFKPKWSFSKTYN